MSPSPRALVDGNEAVASVAYRLSEVIAIYPITPASPMGEHADQWAMLGHRNVWDGVPDVTEMQSEGGAAGALHGALQGGALATTFTASQGLLLMLPNLYKIAGELTPTVVHVAARTVATHALSIFGDHSDVMACRQAGLAMLASASVQEAHDFAAIAHAATLETRVPFLHFMDGFRTSHELAEADLLADDALRELVSGEAIAAHRQRALRPEAPVVRGTAQNPDVFFQAREACNPFYDQAPNVVSGIMNRFGDLTGRRYAPFEYVGHPNAERVVVLMGSGAVTAEATVRHLAEHGERVGAVKVRLYRPFDGRRFAASLPSTARALAVLDRTKEPGAPGEPLYLDVVAAMAEAHAEPDRLAPAPRIIGGRYGLSSKELTPAMVKTVLDELTTDRPRTHFSVGIVDDVTHRSLSFDESFDIERPGTVRAVFFGLGSDGTVSSNKSTIKIIGQETSLHAQAYFVYDSKKAGATTVSHLRFGPEPIQAPYLIRQADFVACHQPQLLSRLPVLDHAAPGATLLLNTPVPCEEIWSSLERDAQASIRDKGLRFYAIDAYAVAEAAGLGRRLSTVMQTCFFALSGLLPEDEAKAQVKRAAEHAYGKRGREVVRRNHEAIDATLAHLSRVDVPVAPTASASPQAAVPGDAPDFVQRVTRVIMEGHGDRLPVSALPVDGTFPTGTSRWEKRAIAREIPIWDPDLCIQCGKCAAICPHATIRTAVFDETHAKDAPASFRSMPARGGLVESDGDERERYVVQVAPDDCTGCGLCVALCPAKDKSNPRHKAIDMQPVGEHREDERENWSFFQTLPPVKPARVHLTVKGSQLLDPLFEFSGACAGCGETPYIKLLTQLFGDRALIANATGCSSIYGGNLPTTPYRANPEGHGPAWSNSLFEDNAEFGLGMRLAVDFEAKRARGLLRALATELGDEVVSPLAHGEPTSFGELDERRARVRELRKRLAQLDDPRAGELARLATALVPKSVWLVGGDGWAYDIGYGGLDHVLATDRNINVLVLDTEVYSNTGGQQSKATPIGAAAKFAAAGKAIAKKDLGLHAMSYGHVYVAQVAMGAKDAQTLRAFQEAAAYPGPSLIIAYSHCIAHGYDLVHGAEQQKLAVDSGVWPLYRFDPTRIDRGEPPLQLDSPRLKARPRDYMKNEARFRMVELRDPARYEQLLRAAEDHVRRRHSIYEQLAGLRVTVQASEPPRGTG